MLKGTNSSAVDPESDAVVRLFHPRQDRWDEHFVFVSQRVIGLTATGRASVWLLQMNAPDRINLRAMLAAAGEH